MQEHQEAIGGLSANEFCIPGQPPGNIISFNAEVIELIDTPIFSARRGTDGIVNLGEQSTWAATAYDEGRKVLLAIEEWPENGVQLNILQDGVLRDGPDLPPDTSFVSRPEISNDGEVMIFLDNYRASPDLLPPEIWVRREGEYMRIIGIEIDGR